MSNLEPIEEGDLDLKSKLKGEAGKFETAEEILAEKKMPEEPMLSEENDGKAPEVSAERKEGAMEKETAYSNILAKTQTTTAKALSDEDVKKDAELVSQEQDEEGKISTLVKMAETSGVVHAVKVAQHFEDNYVLDEFHDRLLADELHKALVEKGILKEL